MNKKGFTLLEVVLTIAFAGAMILTIFMIVNLIRNFQIKQEDRNKAYKIVENIHAMYLDNPENFEIGEKIVYVDKNLSLSNELGYYKVKYILTIDENDVYTFIIIELYTINHTLLSNVDLGRWRLYE